MLIKAWLIEMRARRGKATDEEIRWYNKHREEIKEELKKREGGAE